MKTLEEKRKAVLKQIDLIRNFGTNTKKCGASNKTIGFYSGRLTLLNKYWDNFIEIHYEMFEEISNTATTSSDSHLENLYDVSEIEILYSTNLGEIMESISEIQPGTVAVAAPPVIRPHQGQQHNRNVEVRLPRINIPIFSGEYNSWASFSDLFTSLVLNNNNLTRVEKLYHLKATLSGEAANLLRQFAVTEDNFDPAWALLKKRFANKRLLLNTQFEKLLSIPKQSYNSTSGLKRILDISQECITSIDNLLDADKRYEALLLHIIIQKLDTKSHEAWENSIRGSEDPKAIDEFTKFLEESCRTMELIQQPSKPFSDTQHSSQGHVRSSDRSFKSHHVSSQHGVEKSDKTTCSLCKQKHFLYSCKQFKELSPDDRVKYVSQLSICHNCLSPTHSTASCSSKHTCFICKQSHNTLLHQSNSSSVSTTSNSAQSHSTPATVHSHHHSSIAPQRQVLLATALVDIQSSNGEWHTFRALIDQGSQATFICQSAVQLLRLPISKATTSIKGVGNTCAAVSKCMSQFSFKSLHNDLQHYAEAVVLPNLTSLLPTKSLLKTTWDHLYTLKLADPDFFTPSKIDLLLGADVFSDIILEGMRKGVPGSPIAQETTLGWILSGNVTFDGSRSIEVVSCFSDVTISEQLQRFWRIEEIEEEPKQSDENQLCENHFAKTFKRSSSGVYTVRLPFKNGVDFPQFGFTWKQALTRLHQMERRFVRDPELKTQYKAFMEEYLKLGHMHRIQRFSQTDLKSFYLPHHAVFKESSTTTKVRVVFDASCKSSTGISLNDQLLAGPTLQQDLVEIMLRWRTHKVAITADIEKMFRQIRVASEHQPYQRILWRDGQGEIDVFELDTVTYGTSSAPFLSIRVIRQLAIDESSNFPLAHQKTLNDMYVDDLISGADTKEQAIALQRETIAMFQKGGFTLRKWASNETDVITSVPEGFREQSVSLDISRDDTIKTLGIHWRPESDSFCFKVNLPTMLKPPTKRILLSDVARIYDPLGWLSPVVVRAKILLQDLWLTGLNWDDPLPDNTRLEWEALRKHLVLLEQLSIPRWIQSVSTNPLVEYHGFCDASLKAYGAVVYSRVIDGDTIKVSLLTAKTRVAPLKQLSLPNLELSGAALLSKLLQKIAKSLGVLHQNVYAWTDSTIVISWLKSNSHKKVFVANRVTTILDHTSPHQWSHVRSSDNPADVASRGICPTRFALCDIWWKGPTWLSQTKDTWPTAAPLTIDSENPELFCAKISIEPNDTVCGMLEKYSNLQHLLRVMSYCLRFAKKKTLVQRNTSFLSAVELRHSLNILIKATQLMDFAEELDLLGCKESSLSSSNKLRTLNPFVCANGFLRVGGRLQNADIDYDAKCPILLSRKNPLTKLIIMNAHVVTTLHGGAKSTLAAIRTRFWIPSARTAIRSCIHQCIRCHKYSSHTNRQIMASLPTSRVSPSKVFSHAGVDYAGPFDVRLSKHRGRIGTLKGYVCVFVCFSSKAVHVELVSDLTSMNFIAAFKRFVSRRGTCSDLYSDCGTNFIGANKLLDKDMRKALADNQDQIGETLSNHGTQWHFNSPSSPHMGGLWEASVKSFKYHLKRIVGDSVLTYEELYTVLTQIEAVLNSRPLCPLSNDPNDLDALTPGHFLVGCPLNSVPQPSLLEKNPNRLQRWQLLEKVHQDFWRSWSRDYLMELHQRPKQWSKPQLNISIGDLVLVKDDRTAPGQWPLARVVNTHPGPDGQVRVVTIRHKSGEAKRPIVKLSPLPINDQELH